LTPIAVQALQDCRLLAELNLDFLTDSYRTIGSASSSKSLPLVKADDVRTLLSGVLTNQQTCLDGVKAAGPSWSLKNGVVQPLSDDTKLYSISLSLFTKAWAPKKRKSANNGGGRRESLFRRGRIPALKMSSRAKAILESATGDHRRLLQEIGSGGDQVLIRDLVTVSKDGSGNFTLINDAVAAAPNKTHGTDGYFLIYVAAGVYEENVIIDKKKKYVMMIGDGINRTIITGNRSVADNYTTFNSATFGKYTPTLVAPLLSEYVAT